MNRIEFLAPNQASGLVGSRDGRKEEALLRPPGRPPEGLQPGPLVGGRDKRGARSMASQAATVCITMRGSIWCDGSLKRLALRAS
jgi:hypothetical protein